MTSDCQKLNEAKTSDAEAARLRRRPLGRYRYVRLRWRVLFTLIDAVGQWIFDAVRLVKRLFAVLPAEHPRATDPQSILLVQLDHLGDAILSTGMIGQLRRRWPKASIEVLVGHWNRDLFAAMPEVDRVHASKVNRFSRTGRFGWPLAVFWWGLRLRRRRFDLAIDARGEFPLALMLWLSGARRRLGWAAGGGRFLLTDSAEFSPHRHEIESRGALLAALGIDGEPEGLLPRFQPTETARRQVARRLEQEGLCGPFVAVHISAGTAAKQWPIDHWQSLVGRLIVEHGIEVVIVGSLGDRPLVQAVLEGKTWPGAYDWTGRCGLVELAALIERAEAVVGADSGPVHLAASLGRPAVVLFSGTNHVEQWRPPGRRVAVLRHLTACSPCHREACPRADHPCMRLLMPEQVLAAVIEAYREQRQTKRKPYDSGRKQMPCGPLKSNRRSGVHDRSPA